VIKGLYLHETEAQYISGYTFNMRIQGMIKFTTWLTLLMILSGCTSKSSYKPENPAFDNFKISEECVTPVEIFEAYRKIAINLLNPQDLPNSVRDSRRYTYAMADLTMKEPNCFPSELSRTWAQSAKDMQSIYGDSDEEIQNMITQASLEYYQILNNQ
jgi:hypothetical protein